ncbi:hypothetical protein D3C71_1374250 [compost metagenome]
MGDHRTEDVLAHAAQVLEPLRRLGVARVWAEGFDAAHQRRDAVALLIGHVLGGVFVPAHLYSIRDRVLSHPDDQPPPALGRQGSQTGQDDGDFRAAVGGAYRIARPHEDFGPFQHIALHDLRRIDRQDQQRNSGALRDPLQQFDGRGAGLASPVGGPQPGVDDGEPGLDARIALLPEFDLGLCAFQRRAPAQFGAHERGDRGVLRHIPGQLSDIVGPIVFVFVVHAGQQYYVRTRGGLFHDGSPNFRYRRLGPVHTKRSLAQARNRAPG